MGGQEEVQDVESSFGGLCFVIMGFYIASAEVAWAVYRRRPFSVF